MAQTRGLQTQTMFPILLRWGQASMSHLPPRLPLVLGDVTVSGKANSSEALRERSCSHPVSITHVIFLMIWGFFPSVICNSYDDG